MNIRQLKELVLETVAKEQKRNRSKKRKNNRRRHLKQIMETARQQLNEEVGSAKDFYETNIAGTADMSAGNFFNAYGAPLKDYQSAVVRRLFQDNVDVEGRPAGGTMKVAEGNVVVTNLKPSQNEIGVSQSLANVLLGGGWKVQNDDGSIGGDGFHMSQDKAEGAYGLITKDGQLAKFNNPVMAAECKEGLMIIDGHHRWSQIYVCNPTSKIKCVILKGTKNISADDVLQMVHVAIAETAQGISQQSPMADDYTPVPEGLQPDDSAEGAEPGSPEFSGNIAPSQEEMAARTPKGGEAPYSLTKPAKGQNLLTDTSWIGKYRELLTGNADEIEGYSGRGGVPAAMVQWANGEITAKELSEEGSSHVPLGVAVRDGDGENISLDDCLSYFETTVKSMQTKNKPISPAPARTGMPQAGDMMGNEYSEKVLKHIADKKIAIPEARRHKGNRLNERVDNTTNTVLNRWKKLAGLE